MSVTAPHDGSGAAVRVLRRAEIGVTALLWAVVVIGSAVLVLTFPVFTSAASQSLGVSQTAGLPAADVLSLSEDVRRLVAEREFEPLPATWHDAPAFDETAVSHLMDVRAVLAGARVATGIVALLLAAYTAFCVVRARLDRMRAGMRVAAVLCGVVLVLAVVAAMSDFSAFFAAFHGLFFKGGTWVFPADSLLIRLFPQRFWMAAGVAWGVLVAAGAVALLVVSRLTRGGHARYFASRTANNV